MKNVKVLFGKELQFVSLAEFKQRILNKQSASSLESEIKILNDKLANSTKAVNMMLSAMIASGMLTQSQIDEIKNLSDIGTKV